MTTPADCLPGMPEPEPPPVNLANECRAAWHAAYGEVHGTPDPSIARQAMGRIGQLAKDRTDAETWRSLWRACRSAGLDGQWQVSRYLAPKPPSDYTVRGGNAAVRLLMNMTDRPAATTGEQPWPTPRGLPGRPYDSLE